MAIRANAAGVFSTLLGIGLGNIEKAVPQWRAVLSESYRNGMFDAIARVNCFGSCTRFFDPITTGLGLTPSVGVNALAEAQASFDLEAGIAIKDTYSIVAGAQNLFNTFPERETRNIFLSTGGRPTGRPTTTLRR